MMKVLVTVKIKNSISPPIWDKVMMNLEGDSLQDIGKNLEYIKSEVTKDLDTRGIRLDAVKITLESVE